MKVSGWIYIVLMVFFCVLIGQGAAQEEMRMVDNSVFAKPARPASRFQHDQHNETSAIDDCIECHHIYENGQRSEDESSEDQRCADCHDGSKDGPPYGLRKAFHKNCKGCHIERKAGPILCGECHSKASALVP